MGSRPKVVQSNPEEQARIAAEKAAIAANQETAARRVRVGRDRLPSALGQAASTLGTGSVLSQAAAQQANSDVAAAVEYRTGAKGLARVVRTMQSMKR